MDRTLADGAARSSLNLRIKTITQGGQELYEHHSASRPPQVPTAHPNGDVSRPLTDQLRERYTPLPNGVELFYELGNRPAHPGDLVFCHDLELTELTPAPRKGGGIDFQDECGAFAFHIGQVIARDARGRPFVTEPVLNDESTALVFAISGDWLQRASYPVMIDPPIVATEQFMVNKERSTVTSPTVAASNNGFLVAWVDVSGGKKFPVMFARTISSAGAMSTQLVVNDPPRQRPLGIPAQRPQAASDGTDFMVIWGDDQGGIFGSIIQADGTAKVIADTENTTFEIAETTGKLQSDLPLVAYNGERYVVVWHDRDTTDSKAGTGVILYYALVSRDGAEISAKKKIEPLEGFGLNQFATHLASGPDQMVLLIYREVNQLPTQHRAVRIDKDGDILDPGGISLFKADVKEFGFGLPNGIASDGVNGWFILSGFNQANDSAIFRHYLAKEGRFTRADDLQPATKGVFSTMGLGETGLASEDQFAATWMGADVALPGGGNGGEWLFVRNLRTSIKQTPINLLGKRVGFDGTDYDRTPFQIDNSDKETRRSSAAAAAPGIGKFLVAWLKGGLLVTGQGDEIQAVLLDTAGDANATVNTEAALTVVSHPSPVAIRVGTEVTFDWSASAGTITDQYFFPGIGLEFHPEEGVRSQTYTYTSAGVYTARIELRNGNYASSATVQVTVGGGLGTEGAEKTVGGTPAITNSANVNTHLTVTSAEMFLDFTSSIASKDQMIVKGKLDLALLPETASGTNSAGKQATVTLFGPANQDGTDPAGFDDTAPNGSKTYSFFLDDDADSHNSQSTGSDRIDFNVNKTKGTFSFTVTETDLALFMVPDELSHKNPSHDRRVQFGLNIDGVDFGTVTVVTLYSSTEGLSGVGKYFINGTGKEDTGLLEITKISIQQDSGQGEGVSHKVTVSGRLIKPKGLKEPDGTPFTLPETGSWKFTVGTFQPAPIDLAAAISKKKLKETTTQIQWQGSTVSDVTTFKLNRSSGIFTLTMNQVPASPGLGLPLSNATGEAEDLEVLVDFYLGFEWDLEDGPFAISGFTRLERPIAKSGVWKAP